MAKPAPPTWVVFDIMQVLVEWRPDRLYRRLIPDDAERVAFFARTGLLHVNAESTLSGDLGGKVAALAKAHPADAQLILPWWAQWTEMCHAPIPEVGALLMRLRAAGVPVCAFSNFADDALSVAQGRYPVLTAFDAEVISCQFGVAKPDPRLYAAVEARTGAEGAALFFIDDKAENIVTANARGWRTHQYDGWDDLAAALHEVGLGPYAFGAPR